MYEAETTDTDAQLIRSHVIGLFEAFLAGDTAALRDGRIDDWKGFQIRSTRLVRGAGEYLSELKEVMGAIEVSSYEFLDFDVDVYGDLAVVLYTARDYLKSGPGDDVPSTVLVRSLDVYRRIEGDWTQIASNICTIADPSPPEIR